MNFFIAAVHRDLILALRRRNDIINPLAFFFDGSGNVPISSESRA